MPKKPVTTAATMLNTVTTVRRTMVVDCWRCALLSRYWLMSFNSSFTS